MLYSAISIVPALPYAPSTRSGNLKNFTGIDSPYEPPEHAEVQIDTVANAPEEAAETIIEHLRGMGILERG